MELHEQLKRQLKEYKWKDYTKVSVEIAPEYDDFFEKAGDDYIKSIDMIRFFINIKIFKILSIF